MVSARPPGSSPARSRRIAEPMAMPNSSATIPLATMSRILRPSDIGSIGFNIRSPPPPPWSPGVVHPPHGPKHVADFAEGGARAHGVENRLHEGRGRFAGSGL